MQLSLKNKLSVFQKKLENSTQLYLGQTDTSGNMNFEILFDDHMENCLRLRLYLHHYHSKETSYVSYENLLSYIK